MLSTSITLDFHSNEQTVKEVLLAAALSCPRVLKDPEPSVLLQSFEEGALKFKLTFWIKDPESGQQNVLSQVNYAVLKGLREAQIQMPMPQRQVFWSSTPGSHWPAP
jgi:small-conductance mechanosensitive channel